MKFQISILLLLFQVSLTAQKKSDISDRQITVIGSAETIVNPDQVELELVLTTTGNHSNIENIYKRFLEILSSHDIATDDVSLNYDKYNWYSWWSYRGSLKNRRNVKLKLDEDTDFMALVKDLNEPWVRNLKILNTHNSNLTEIRKQVKIEAIKAAKAKAEYLLESIGEKLGAVVSIEEINDVDSARTINVPNYWPYGYYGYRQYEYNPLRHSNSNVSIGNPKSENSVDDVPEIKLRYEVKAVFQIK